MSDYEFMNEELEALAFHQENKESRGDKKTKESRGDKETKESKESMAPKPYVDTCDGDDDCGDIELSQIINLTPHDINICSPDGDVIYAFPASGLVARIDSKQTPAYKIAGIQVSQNTFSSVYFVDAEGKRYQSVPYKYASVLYIVSALVLAHVVGDFADRCIQPDTSPAGAVRDANGRIAGVRGFLCKQKKFKERKLRELQ